MSPVKYVGWLQMCGNKAPLLPTLSVAQSAARLQGLLYTQPFIAQCSGLQGC